MKHQILLLFFVLYKFLNVNQSMSIFNFDHILNTYETERKEIASYEVENKDKDQLNTIKVDIDRSFTFIEGLDPDKRESLRVILHLVLTTIPVSYTQCMSEISSVIVYHYFSEDLDLHLAEKKKATKERDELMEEVEETSDEDEGDNRALTIDSDLLKKTRITITNILREKYEPLIENEFALYLHYNTVFLRMMKKRGVEIATDESLVFMNTTLTWFIRSCKEYKDLITLIGFMLACPTSFPFLLLVKFYDFVVEKKQITSLDEHLYEELITLETEFLETEDEIKQKGGLKSLKKKDFLLVGAAVALGLALLYNITRKKDD